MKCASISTIDSGSFKSVSQLLIVSNFKLWQSSAVTLPVALKSLQMFKTWKLKVCAWLICHSWDCICDHSFIISSAQSATCDSIFHVLYWVASAMHISMQDDLYFSSIICRSPRSCLTSLQFVCSSIFTDPELQKPLVSTAALLQHDICCQKQLDVKLTLLQASD